MKKHNILYAVIGLSPQVLTETLYALIKSEPKFIPDEIFVLTTTRGAELCRLALFKEDGGWFNRFCLDFDLPNIVFTEDHIEVLTNANGETLDDIRTPSDNELTANKIVWAIQNFTKSDDISLHVSIAGGRKTMGFYAGYALSLFGREHDKLSHVLVDDEFEGLSSFYYPPPYSKVVRSRDGRRLLEQRDARVELAYIPFVRMRSLLKMDQSSSMTFNDLVATMQHQFLPAPLAIDVPQKLIYVGEKSVKLAKTRFAFYVWMVDRYLKGLPGIEMPVEGDPIENYRDEYLKIFYQIYGGIIADKTGDTLEKGMDKQFVTQSKARIKEAFVKTIGVNADHYLIEAHGERPYKHGLQLDKSLITLQW